MHCPQKIQNSEFFIKAFPFFVPHIRGALGQTSIHFLQPVHLSGMTFISYIILPISSMSELFQLPYNFDFLLSPYHIAESSFKNTPGYILLPPYVENSRWVVQGEDFMGYLIH